jgi:protein-disulfide isomerase
MRKEVKLLTATAAVLVGGMIVAATLYRRADQAEKAEAAARRPAPASSTMVRPHSPTLGPADAPVTVVEFLDPECETCRLMYPVVKFLMKEYEGKVRLVIRYMAFHGNSVHAVNALDAAAAQGKYWEMLESLFANQPAWGDHHHPKPELIPEYAKQLGLDMAKFNAAMTGSSGKQKVDIDQADGRALGVTGTPTFFVNGKMLDTLGYEPLKARIEQALRGE